MSFRNYESYLIGEIMKRQNLSAFLNNQKNHGVYVFTSDSCELCTQFEKDLSAYDTSSFTAVEVTRDEEVILSEMFSVKSFPFTIVFVDNEVGMIKKGVLFQKQMNDIFEFLKRNNIKSSQPKSPITQLTPIVFEAPINMHNEEHLDYIKDIIADCISKGEAPLNTYLLLNGCLDLCNPVNLSIANKMKESWGLLAKKTVVYSDFGVSDEMINGITDAVARGREVEFRRLYEN